MTRKYLLIAVDDASSNWYEELEIEPISIYTKEDDSRLKSPRIHALLTEEQADQLKINPVIRYCGRIDITDQEISDRILDLYQEKTPMGDKAGDALLNLMLKIKQMDKHD